MLSETTWKYVEICVWHLKLSGMQHVKENSCLFKYLPFDLTLKYFAAFSLVESWFVKKKKKKANKKQKKKKKKAEWMYIIMNESGHPDLKE